MDGILPGDTIDLLATGDFVRDGVYHLYASFSKADNFSDAQGRMVSLTAVASLMEASTLLVSAHVPGSVDVIEVTPGLIWLNSTSYDKTNTALYSSEYLYPDLKLDNIRRRVQEVIKEDMLLFPEKSLFHLLLASNNQGFTSAFEKALAEEFWRAFERFQQDVAGGVRSFRGRGFGLTPSGDDFIAGVLYGLHGIEMITKQDLRALREQLYRQAIGSNLFSNHLLLMAREARYFKRLKDVLQAMFSGKKTDTVSCLKQLAGVGKTSGADLLCGFFAVLLHQTAFPYQK